MNLNKISIETVYRLLHKVRKFFLEDIWHIDLGRFSRFQALLLQQLQGIYMIIRSLIKDRLLVRASALVYSTLLSVVPMLAVMFSVLKAFGVHNKLDDTLVGLLSQSLGSNNAHIISEKIVVFVDNISVGAIGSVGVALLFFAVISVVNNVERAFNDIWNIQKVRSFRRKFADYLSILLVGPVFVFAVLGITASFQSNAIVQRLLEFKFLNQLLTQLIPFIVSWFIFAFLNSFVPNTRVNLFSAILGGLVGGTLWQISNWAFATFVVNSYQSGAKAVLYASFATLPLFLLWIYVSWAIVLLSAETTFIHQNIKKVQWKFRVEKFNDADRENLLLRLMVIIGRNFFLAEPAPSIYSLAHQCNVPPPLVLEVIQRLVQYRFVSELEGEPATYQPGCDFNNLTIKSVLDEYRGKGEKLKIIGEKSHIDEIITNVEEEMDMSLDRAIGKYTFQQLVLQSLDNKPGSLANPIINMKPNSSL